VASIASPSSIADSLRTERLVLRRWSAADVEHLARWAQDPQATRYVLRRPLEDAEVEENHERSLQAWRALGFGKRAVLAADSGRWLGFTELSYVSPGKGCRADDVEIGYFLLPSAWGRGVATEAAVAARDEAFRRVGVTELFGRFRIEHTASARVLEKAGFSFLRRHRFPDGNVVDVTRLTLDRWQALIEAGGPIPQDARSSRRPAVPSRDVWL